ncbi:hypothetical protein D3C81_1048230 [compost metagenome]
MINERLERLYRNNQLEVGKRYQQRNVGDHGIDADARPFLGQIVVVEQWLKSGLYKVSLPGTELTYNFPKSCLWPLPDEAYYFPEEMGTGPLTAGKLKQFLADKEDNLEIFFERVAPVCGNVEQAYVIAQETYAFFGHEIPCLIIRQCPPDPVDPEDPEGQGA